jgi:SAM-dependent methyltransferase
MRCFRISFLQAPTRIPPRSKSGALLPCWRRILIDVNSQNSDACQERLVSKQPSSLMVDPAMFPNFVWYESAASLVASADASLARILAIEDHIVKMPVVDGYCVNCERIVPFTVFGGAMLGTHINLREGMVCQACGLNARSRLLLLAASELFASGDQRLAVMEAFSPFAVAIKRRWPTAQLSEYFGPDLIPGEVTQRTATLEPPEAARHEDLMGLSYGDESLDGIVHNDVLEHVSEVTRALREIYRVLRPGGMALFTMPWFPWLQKSLVRGRLLEDGSIDDFLPPEFHGDGLRPQGIYTFYNFGADFGDMLAQAGFEKARYGVCYAPMCGFLSNNYRYGTDGLMMPSVLMARRPL